MILSADLFTSIIVLGVVGSVAVFTTWGAILIIDQQKELAEAERSRSELEKLLKEAQFLQLSAQIQPHFLFNALNIIDSMIRLGKMEEAHQAVSALSSLLRYRLNDLNRLITVHEEIEYVKNYLTIQKLRFGPRLETVIDVDEQLGSCLIPPLSVQTLVENACLHGIEPRLEGGEVWIQGRLLDGAYQIDVIDNGVGIDARVVGEINRRLQANDSLQPGEGIGLKNVHQRLRYLLGEGSVLTINSSLGIGTHCKITVKCQGRDRDESTIG